MTNTHHTIGMLMLEMHRNAAQNAVKANPTAEAIGKAKDAQIALETIQEYNAMAIARYGNKRG